MIKSINMIVVIVVLLLGVGLFYFSQKAAPLRGTISRLVVNKSKRELLAFDNKDKLLKRYRIALGSNPVGHKQIQGDGKTPEGIYYVNDKNPNSIAYKNLGISYPNDADSQHAMQLGKSPGGDIKIHGLMNGWGFLGWLNRYSDWTAGCIAVTNSEMEELYRAVKIGTHIEINP
jgi:murein L,D-transpeptidase YafK